MFTYTPALSCGSNLGFYGLFQDSNWHSLGLNDNIGAVFSVEKRHCWSVLVHSNIKQSRWEKTEFILALCVIKVCPTTQILFQKRIFYFRWHLSDRTAGKAAAGGNAGRFHFAFGEQTEVCTQLCSSDTQYRTLFMCAEAVKLLQSGSDNILTVRTKVDCSYASHFRLNLFFNKPSSVSVTRFFFKEENMNKSQGLFCNNTSLLNECEICHQSRAGRFYCIIFMQKELKSFDLLKLKKNPFISKNFAYRNTTQTRFYADDTIIVCKEENLREVV